MGWGYKPFDKRVTRHTQPVFFSAYLSIYIHPAPFAHSMRRMLVLQPIG
jgi:hypothetical protein